MTWAEVDAGPIKAMWAASGGHGTAWKSDDGERMVIVGVEDGRWHLSISRRDRLPTWGEIGDARDRFVPKDIVLCVPFPPRKWWLNMHRFCLHLWEIRDVSLIEQWKYEGAAARAGGFSVPS